MSCRIRARLGRLVACAMLAAGASGPIYAEVQVVEGPTPIPGGNAQSGGDITLRNGRLAVTIAAETAPPYGVPPGSIVDAAPVVDGEIAGAGDTLTQVDLIPNNWSAWPNTYSRVEVVENTGKRGVVRVERDWGEVIMTTTYSLGEGSDQVRMVTQMRNEGDETLADLLSGYVLWERSGSFFGIPGIVPLPGSDESVPESGAAEGAFGSWNALYGEDWAFAVHFPAFERFDYSGRDLYVEHTLEPGQSRRFEGWFQVVPAGDLSRIVAAASERKGRTTGKVEGTVATESGTRVKQPAVVALRDGKPYAWGLGDNGRYALSLPAGDYQLYATARAHSRSALQDVRVESDQSLERDFTDLREPGEIRFSVRDAEGPVDARITVAEGQTPLIGFLGRSTFFTAATGAIGEARFRIAPGDYLFEIDSGAGFVSSAVRTDTIGVPAAGQVAREIRVDTKLHPAREGWYAADLHHHSLGAEGVTPPEYAFRSQMAAGLDLAFISDHDTMKYLPPVAELAGARGVPFIPSVEISPSWGHFNPYPVEIGQQLGIDPATAGIDQILERGRALGAELIQANHPTNPYGYFTSLESGDVPGGFNPGFGGIEMNPCCYEDTWAQAQHWWNRHLSGELERFYPITAGSDAHDVWSERSGEVRLFARVPGELSVDAYVAAAKAGHSYASFGPLLFPRTAAGSDEPTLFGKTFRTETGEPFNFALDLKAVRGLKRVTLVREGEAIESRDLSGRGVVAENVAFSVTPERDTWYALVVEDGGEKLAYSNPIWVDRP